jgi:transcription elongation factor Elf1
MTEIWFECPDCKKETYPNWDTFSFAGKFVSPVVCKHCGFEFEISVTVSCPTSRAVDVWRAGVLESEGNAATRN